MKASTKILYFIGVLFVILLLVLLTIVVMYFTPVDGRDTENLKEKLLSLDKVIAVKNYQEHEGDASFTLELSGNRKIGLGEINNLDLVSAEHTIIIHGINGSVIYCRHDSRGIGQLGIGIHTIEQQLSPNSGININNLQDVISNFDYYKRALSNFPIKLQETTYKEIGPESWTCRDQSK